MNKHKDCKNFIKPDSSDPRSPWIIGFCLLKLKEVEPEGEACPNFERRTEMVAPIGKGQGVGKPKQGAGGRDLCVCPKCNQIHQHPRGTPCVNWACVKCGAQLAPYAGEK